MDWIKRNLVFVIGAVVMLGLTGVAGWYGWNGFSRNAAQSAELRKESAELRRLEQWERNPANTGGSIAQVAVIKLSCRAVDRNGMVAGANNQTAYTLDSELKKSGLFRDVKLDPLITEDPATGTFTFGVNVVLKKPLALAAANN